MSSLNASRKLAQASKSSLNNVRDLLSDLLNSPRVYVTPSMNMAILCHAYFIFNVIAYTVHTFYFA